MAYKLLQLWKLLQISIRFVT